ncbi:MADF domain-containing protein [Aphelenchoides fujianensis]|nr:MADF domain-containing protein [Aphelenchoides fujianensis]
MSTSQYTPTTDDSSNDLPEGQKRKSRIAHYTDDLRIELVKHVFQRPVLWATTRDAVGSVASASLRKKAFGEVAALLQTKSPTITAKNVESQWKNLKDTYSKVKKKSTQADAESPRWRFFRLLRFLDEPAESKALRPREGDRRAAKGARDPRDAPPAAPFDQRAEDEPHLSARAPAAERRPAIPVHKTPVSRLKRPNDGDLAYSRHAAAQPPPSSSSTEDLNASNFPVLTRDSTPQSNGAGGPIQSNGLSNEEDEYTLYCKALIHPLKEIGELDRMALFKCQKTIRDVIFEAQSKVHSARGLPNGSGHS